MSINNSILLTLNFKDENIIFYENFVNEEEIKGKKCLVYNAYLCNHYEYCPKCGCINEESIIKKGTETSMIKLNKISERTSYLKLNKQYYKCKHCNKKFVASTPEVNFRCTISNNVKRGIFVYAKEPMSKTLIARLFNVSDNTVQTVFDTALEGEKLYKTYLPEAICFDEFTYKNGIFAFNMCDATTGKTIDLVPSLDKYFSYYPKEVREKVKFIVVDMYAPYISLIKKWFPNAKIIIDFFHIIQSITKKLNKTRINVMRNDKEDRNKFKRYWRLILMSHFDLDCSEWKKYRCFDNLMTQVDVVNYLLDQDENLKNSYNLYQDILYYMQHRDYDSLKMVITKEYSGISEEMNSSLKTLNKFSEYIENTMNYQYSNGVMERNNNTCKLFKRISFGYRNFKNMKSRIMIVTNIFRTKKREYYTKYSTPKFA